MPYTDVIMKSLEQEGIFLYTEDEELIRQAEAYAAQKKRDTRST